MPQTVELQEHAIVRAPSAPEIARRAPDDASARRGGASINVHSTERMASALAGGLAVAWGLSQRSLLGRGALLLGSALVYRAVSGHCHLYGALGVSTADDDATHGVLPKLHKEPPSTYTLRRAVTVSKSAAELYALWKQPETLARVMSHFAEVESAPSGRTRWTVRDPLGHAHTWETEIVEDEPGRRVRWASTSGAAVEMEGALELGAAPGDRGTELGLSVRIARPSGVLGSALVKLLGPVPSLLAERALKNLKALAEAGELPSLASNPAARPSAAV